MEARLLPFKASAMHGGPSISLFLFPFYPCSAIDEHWDGFYCDGVGTRDRWGHFFGRRRASSADLHQLENGQERFQSSYTEEAALADQNDKTTPKGRRIGGWNCGMLLLVNQGLVTLAYAGVEVNLVLFSKSVLRQTNAEAANTFSRWMGTTYCFSLLGAFLSDSYLGRYLTCIIFQLIFIVGLIALSLLTHISLLKPNGCGKIGQLCDPHGLTELSIFYISIYLIALGNGAPEPALATFGAEQFDDKDPKENRAKASFYSYFYVSINMGCLFSETVLVYMENLGHWKVGFWICGGSALLGYILLLSGSSRYRQSKPCGNPISRFSQVVMASMKKMNLPMPSNGEGLYEGLGKEATRRMLHTEGFKFLDRAAILTAEEMNLIWNQGQTPNPWQICCVSQVEEVKCILRLLPVWFCTIFSSVVFIQMLSLFVEQGASMDTVVSNFHIPPASMTAFDIVSTTLFIMLYDRLLVPIYIRIAKRRPKPPNELQRIGIGLAIAIVALVIAGFVEQKRLRHASISGEETSSLSIFWQTPQYVLVGVSEAFVYVAQMDFFASQTPDGLKSLGMGLSMSSTAMGSYLASMILTIVMAVTETNGKPGWVPPNLNDGHLDRFFFLSAALTALNLAFYVICAKRYKGSTTEKQDGDREEELDREFK
ncbi:protein NRT1/ PTR FAMILY 7.3-like isoform X3 [Momordica charantia]|uniref:Protein NRT1/ PTR FAMILY 7.3-like isoform X3 n=1 Tax=Momordica charantia TaxID=3673 RepID=A0A6J1DR89_MOMCH|nr:protein NRT1/ PTR FAMILY 7.3-like isoform X3 [Momordica charantia]